MLPTLPHPPPRLSQHLLLTTHALRTSTRPLHPIRLRLRPPHTHRASTSTRPPITSKSRILEKPTRFNPPSHGARRVRPRQYPGAPLTEHERDAQAAKRYPNMMPPKGSFMYSFLADRRVHLWITLGTLTTLAFYSLAQSFLHTTIYRQDLPYWSDLLSHPLQTTGQFFKVYKAHVAYESEKVAGKRRLKLADAQKRKEFLREHGVEPGFLTGSWMEKFGTEEGDRWKAEREAAVEVGGGTEGVVQSPVGDGREETVAMVAGGGGAGGSGGEGEQEEVAPHRREKKKVKMWLGIW